MRVRCDAGVTLEVIAIEFGVNHALGVGLCLEPEADDDAVLAYWVQMELLLFRRGCTSIAGYNPAGC